NRLSLGMSVPPPLLRSSHPAIPAGVEVVVQKALSFDPEARYPDAGAMLEALDEAIREIAETPLEPYAGVHFDPPVAGPPRQRQRPDDDDETRIMPPPPVVGIDDDRTQLLGEDDRTLAAPGPPPPDGVPPSRAFPPRPPL